MQKFPFIKDFSSQDVKLILQRYTEDTGGVNVKAMTKDLEEAMENVPGPRRTTMSYPTGMVRRQTSTPQRASSMTALRSRTSPAAPGLLTTERKPAGDIRRPLSGGVKKSTS